MSPSDDNWVVYVALAIHATVLVLGTIGFCWFITWALYHLTMW